MILVAVIIALITVLIFALMFWPRHHVREVVFVDQPYWPSTHGNWYGGYGGYGGYGQGRRRGWSGRGHGRGGHH